MRAHDVGIGIAVARARRAGVRCDPPLVYSEHVAIKVHSETINAWYYVTANRGPLVDTTWLEHMRLSNTRVAFMIGAAQHGCRVFFVDWERRGFAILRVRDVDIRTGVIDLDPKRWPRR